MKLKKSHWIWIKDKIMGIDPGVNNFATIVTTEGPHVQLWTGEN